MDKFNSVQPKQFTSTVKAGLIQVQRRSGVSLTKRYKRKQ